MHALGFVALHKVWFVTISGEQVREFLIAQTPKHRGIRDLIAIQMKNGQHRSIPRGIEKLIGMPTGRERSGFGLSVSDNATGQQIRVVENRSIGVRDGVPQLSPFVNRAGSLGGGVTWDSSGERKLLEE